MHNRLFSRKVKLGVDEMVKLLGRNIYRGRKPERPAEGGTDVGAGGRSRSSRSGDPEVRTIGKTI